jgi:hypothetical protein
MSDEAAVRVSFDDGGRVWTVEPSPVIHANDSVLDKVRRRLGL